MDASPDRSQYWVRHFRSGRWGLVMFSEGDWHFMFFPDLQEYVWRRAAVFLPAKPGVRPRDEDR